MVTQCAMLEVYGIFLVLANKVKRPLVPKTIMETISPQKTGLVTSDLASD